MQYQYNEIEKRWQKYWEENKTFAAEDNSVKPKFYALTMFPYPSGAGLHVGHPLGYIACDIYARYKRLQGYNVLQPMGYDSFGLPAEQYAIQTGQHPAITTKTNINGGEDKDGNKRFGMAEAAKLTEARKTAERNRVAALNKSRIPLSPQKQEDISVEETTTINNNVKKEIMYFAGTDIPIDFDFQTNNQMLKLQKDFFAKKVNTKDYQITVDDIVDAVEYGYTIPGFSGLKNIMAGDRENLVKIAAKVKIGKQKGLNPESEGVLNPAERRIWSIATNINLDDLQKNSMDLMKSKIQMKDAQRKAGFVNIDDNKVMKNFSNKDLVATVEAQINSYLEENDNLKTIYTDNLEQTSRNAFVFNVFNTIEYLTETKKVNFTSAINEAIEIQMNGIYKFQDDPTRIINPLSWIDNTTHRVEFVDLNVINQLSKNIETDQDARNMRDYMNDYRYVQNLTDEKGVNLRPDSLGKEFVEGNYRFFVVDIDPRENLNVLKWDYQYIGD